MAKHTDEELAAKIRKLIREGYSYRQARAVALRMLQGKKSS